MSFLVTRPEALATAASHLNGIGSGMAAECGRDHAPALRPQLMRYLP